MATDPKLISSLLDLSRNVDKLSGDIKKNTATTSDLVEVQEKSAEGTKDLGKVADSIKGLDLKSLKGEFSQLTKSIGGLDFKSLSTDLKSLDFKSLSKDLKSLDFKGLTEGIKGLDFKGIGDMAKGLDIKSLAGGLKEGGGIKDVVSGSLGGLLKGGKGLLGAFEKGGPVNQTGQYLVGEKGPEIVKLQQGSAVIPNDILKARQDILKKLGPDAPSEKEISRKRNELLTADPVYYDGEPDWLEEDINSYLEGLQGKVTSEFTQDDLKKLTKPVNNKAEEVVNPPAPTDKKEKKSEEKEAKLKEKKEGLFSRIFGKKDKENDGKAEEDKNKSDIFAKGKDLLKDVDKTKLLSSGSDLLKGASGMFGDKLGGKLGTAGNILGVGSELSKQVKLPSLAKKAPELKTPELKTDIKKLSTPPAPKAQPKPAAAKEEVSEGKKSPTEAVSTESKTSDKPVEAKSEKMGDSGMTSNDIQEMKSALVRIASLLEGPLNVSPMSGPYRPDSRRV
jgi:hypothetical protein